MKKVILMLVMTIFIAGNVWGQGTCPPLKPDCDRDIELKGDLTVDGKGTFTRSLSDVSALEESLEVNMTDTEGTGSESRAASFFYTDSAPSDYFFGRGISTQALHSAGADMNNASASNVKCIGGLMSLKGEQSGGGGAFLWGGFQEIKFNTTSGPYTAITDLIGYEALITRGSVNNQNHTATNIHGIKSNYRDDGGSGNISATLITNFYGVTFPSAIGGTQATIAGLWLEPVTAGDTNNYGVVLDGTGDGSGLFMGTSQEASLTYDGTDFDMDQQLTITVIDPTTNSFAISTSRTADATLIGISNISIDTSTGTASITQGVNNVLSFRGEGTKSTVDGIIDTVTFHTEDNPYTITTLSGMKHQLQTAGAASAVTHTITNHYGFYSTGLDSGPGAINGTDWHHFHADDWPDYGGTIANVAGLYVADQTSGGTINAGVILVDGADCVWMDGLVGTAICNETVIFDAAEVNALTTPGVIVAARGVDTWIEFVSAVMVYDYDTVFAEPSSPDDLVIEYEDNTDTSASITASGFLTVASDQARFAVNSLTTDQDLATLINQNLELFNTGGNYTGGTGNSEVVGSVDFNNDIINKAAHGFNNGDPVTIASTECGITAGTVYWVCEDNGSNQFALDTTQGCGFGADCSFCRTQLDLTSCTPAQAITAQSILSVKITYKVHVLGL